MTERTHTTFSYFWKKRQNKLEQTRPIFDKPEKAHKTKLEYQDIMEVAHVEITFLAKRQKQIVMNKAEQLSRRAGTCIAIQ